MRHTVDSPAWKLVDHMWPDFGSEPRNLRLAISTDEVNPLAILIPNIATGQLYWLLIISNRG